MKRILVIGSSNIDLVVRVPDIPAVGETIMSLSTDRLPGGKGANQAFACGKLGGSTTFLSVVGNDMLADIIIDSMNKANVDISRMEKAADTQTGMALICINNHGDNSIIVIPGANTMCDIEYLKRHDKAFLESDIIALQMEIPLDSVYYSIRRAKELGKTVILDPAPAPDRIPEDIYRQLDFITPNETELQKLSGFPVDNRKDLLKAGKVLLSWGVANVLVTLGAKGAMLLNKGGEKFFTPPQVNVVDTTAAGDTFNAAFTVKAAEGESYEEAIRFANLASSLAVSKLGAQSSIPSRKEVIEFASSLNKQVKKC